MFLWLLRIWLIVLFVLCIPKNSHSCLLSFLNFIMYFFKYLSSWIYSVLNLFIFFFKVFEDFFLVLKNEYYLQFRLSFFFTCFNGFSFCYVFFDGFKIDFLTLSKLSSNEHYI